MCSCEQDNTDWEQGQTSAISKAEDGASEDWSITEECRAGTAAVQLPGCLGGREMQ